MARFEYSQLNGHQVQEAIESELDCQFHYKNHLSSWKYCDWSHILNSGQLAHFKKKLQTSEKAFSISPTKIKF